MIIDKESKVFGLINIIDLLIIIALIGGIVFAGIKLSNKPEVTSIVSSSNQQYVMRFYVETIEDFTADKMVVGDDLYDDSKEIFLGKIVEVNRGESIEWNPNAEGVLVNSPKEGWSSLEVVTELSAQKYDHGIIISGNKYSVGQGLTIRGGSKIYLRVSGIEEKGADN